MEMGNRSILLVDDDQVTLEIMKIYLEDSYKVTTVSSGEAALDFLARQSVDLILLDYMMPEMDGPTVFQHIRNNFSDSSIPIVFLTGVSDKELVIKGLELHPMDYMLKPVSRTDLLERVQRIFGKA